jgi:hypothetical protein
MKAVEYEEDKYGEDDDSQRHCWGHDKYSRYSSTAVMMMSMMRRIVIVLFIWFIIESTRTTSGSSRFIFTKISTMVMIIRMTCN